MSAPSKSAIAVVRAWPRRASLTRDADGNLGFALRLLVGFIATLAVELTADDRERIEAAVPAGAAAGDRYPAQQMQMLDSER